MGDDLQRGYLLALAAAAVNSPATAAAWCAALGSARAVVAHLRDERSTRPAGVRAFAPALRSAIAAIDARAALAALTAARDAGTSFTALDDADYPRRLRDQAEPPLVLYYRGDLSALAGRCVAVVGSRAASAYGRAVAAGLAAQAAPYGATIVSGLARGIDAAAHKAALDAGVPTVAVLGSGLGHVFPAYHEPLAHDVIAAGGAVVTEFAPDITARPAFFPQRNRIVAALADATVAVEAAARSGALITVRLADEIGRPVFAIPGDVDRPTSQGTNALIQDGVALATCFADVAAWLGWEPSLARPADGAASSPADPVLAALRERPLDADELGERCGLDASSIAARLSVLEIAGAVRREGVRFVLTDACGRAAN